jgi:hypothetical protein
MNATARRIQKVYAFDRWRTKLNRPTAGTLRRCLFLSPRFSQARRRSVANMTPRRNAVDHATGIRIRDLPRSRSTEVL